MLNHHIQLEICAGSLTDVIHASSIPEVDRIELNSSLESGGLTPSFNTLLLSKKYSDKKIICMVRPRQAGFLYNDYEKETMLLDAKTFLENGADGIVFGSLNQDFTIDMPFTEQMVKLIHQYGKEAVFHKAFDEVIDSSIALEQLIQAGVDRILTSGSEPTTLAGAQNIKKLIQQADGRIQILPGGGVTIDNIRKIIHITGADQIHMTAKTTYEDITGYYGVDQDKIQEIVNLFTPHKTRVFTREDQEMFSNDQYENTMFDTEDDHDRM